MKLPPNSFFSCFEGVAEVASASSWTDYSFSRRVLFFQKAGFRAYTMRRWVGLRGAMEASFPLAWAHHLWLTTTGKAHFPPAADSPGLFLPPVLGLDHAHNGFLLIGVATRFIFHRLLHFHLQSRRHSAFRNDNDLLPVTSPSHQLLGNFFPSSGGFPRPTSQSRGFRSLLGQMATEENAGRPWHRCQLARGPRISSLIPQGTVDWKVLPAREPPLYPPASHHFPFLPSYLGCEISKPESSASMKQTALSFWEGGRRQYLRDRADEVGLTLGHNHILINSFCSISLSVGWKTIYREKGKLLSLVGPTLCQGQELTEGRRLMVSQGLLGGGQPC